MAIHKLACVTFDEAAELFDVSVREIYRRLRLGELPGVHLQQDPDLTDERDPIEA
jgi:predicted DNA-binding transcriptional regulator YafY